MIHNQLTEGIIGEEHVLDKESVPSGENESNKVDVKRLPDSVRTTKQVISRPVKFSDFEHRFVRELSSPTIGSSYGGAVVGGTSPAAKFISSHQADQQLKGKSFLLAVHRLARECEQLRREQTNVKAVTKQYRPEIRKRQDIIKTLERIESGLKKFTKRAIAVSSPANAERLQHAIDSLAVFRSEMVEQIATLGSAIYPSDRSSKTPTSKWELLLPPYEYTLSTLHRCAPDQWLWVELDKTLRKHVPALAAQRSNTTRFTIIAVLLDCLGLGWVEPAAIKQFFVRIGG